MSWGSQSQRFRQSTVEWALGRDKKPSNDRKWVRLEESSMCEWEPRSLTPHPYVLRSLVGVYNYHKAMTADKIEQWHAAVQGICIGLFPKISYGTVLILLVIQCLRDLGKEVNDEGMLPHAAIASSCFEWCRIFHLLCWDGYTVVDWICGWWWGFCSQRKDTEVAQLGRYSLDVHFRISLWFMPVWSLLWVI